LEQALGAFREIVGRVNGRRSEGDLVVAESIGESLEKKTECETIGLNELIPEKAIRPVGTLHLTLGVMSLESGERIQGAISLLQELDVAELLARRPPESVNASGKEMAATEVPPMSIDLSSLVSMHPPTRTSVLYAAPLDPTDRLQSFGERLRNSFMDAGFLVPDDRLLKLHATVINTVYAKSGTRGHQRQPRGQDRPGSIQNTSILGRVIAESSTPGASGTAQEVNRYPRENGSLDATLLLEQCKDFVWAKNLRIERLAICKMGAKKVLDSLGNVVDEKYEEIASIKLPG
jgi:activating signal cointegrator complex subunit 1